MKKNDKNIDDPLVDGVFFPERWAEYRSKQCSQFIPDAWIRSTAWEYVNEISKKPIEYFSDDRDRIIKSSEHYDEIDREKLSIRIIQEFCASVRRKETPSDFVMENISRILSDTLMGEYIHSEWNLPLPWFAKDKVTKPIRDKRLARRVHYLVEIDRLSLADAFVVVSEALNTSEFTVRNAWYAANKEGWPAYDDNGLPLVGKDNPYNKSE